MGLLDTYDPGSAFSEMFDGADIRPHYRQLAERLQTLGTTDFEDRARLTESTFRNLGITFAVYGGDEGTERTWPIDLLPRIISAAEWTMVEAGLIQRTRALNAFLEDIYVGGAAAVRDGIIPGWLVHSSDGYQRAALGIAVKGGSRVVVAGIDLVRDDEGVYRVLEDNLRVPSGISYVVENRAAMRRAFPLLFEQYPVRPVDDYGSMLLEALEYQAPPGVHDPTVVVLTPGPFNSAYFEHAFLARRMGVELVEGRDLLVNDHVVYMRTTRGLEQVHVIYRRIDDEFMDPVVFDRTSVLGVPGLMAAIRSGNIAVANAIGNGVADDKAVYPYIPDLISYYFNEEPILPNATTYTLWDADQREHVLSRLDELVVKPVAEAGGYGIVIGRVATDEELAETRRNIEANPRNYIAQEVVELSTHPTFIGDRLAPRHIDLRPFIVTGDLTRVVPGGLTRVAMREGSLIVNSSQGGGSKDTWVLDSEGAG
ncbi:MAG: circularly permuted type 2 ATP-grasp protein [Acidimicrobiia bacterium]|nr:circularly permuted type 2 ATP-grasp protein [Acidimicrobiia bacterium]NNF87912.1 circularly permuted type 2 ATP-grasp protein [Acidimicrobiia bacterium]NNJ47340.1 circularly permuted type 2 ATP-grasp protein [Acidimicrobiia bacterium]NNL13520.1 circularly permuted type 2 ATP-grasp protein [Acidimicrobiia bacterium]NNL98910.1 circularly permuted type 2 ATP-grasp protein [Acidimicrobiia bacterium]